MPVLPNGVAYSGNSFALTAGRDSFYLDDYAAYLDKRNKSILVYGMDGMDSISGGNVALSGSGNNVRVYDFKPEEERLSFKFYGGGGEDLLNVSSGGTYEIFGGQGFDYLYSGVGQGYARIKFDNYRIEGDTIIWEVGTPPAAGIRVGRGRGRSQTQGDTFNSRDYTKVIIHRDVELISFWPSSVLLTSDLFKGVIAYDTHPSLNGNIESFYERMDTGWENLDSSVQTHSSGGPDSSSASRYQKIDLSLLVGGGSTSTDSIYGTSAADFISFGEGPDRLTGGNGSDSFVLVGPDGFGRKAADVITDFRSYEKDRIVLGKVALPGLSSVVLSVANSKSELKSALLGEAQLVYAKYSGELIYNENGRLGGFGSGGLFAVLEGGPYLESGDIFFLEI